MGNNKLAKGKGKPRKRKKLRVSEDKVKLTRARGNHLFRSMVGAVH